MEADLVDDASVQALLDEIGAIGDRDVLVAGSRASLVERAVEPSVTKM